MTIVLVSIAYDVITQNKYIYFEKVVLSDVDNMPRVLLKRIR